MKDQEKIDAARKKEQLVAIKSTEVADELARKYQDGIPRLPDGRIKVIIRPKREWEVEKLEKERSAFQRALAHFDAKGLGNAGLDESQDLDSTFVQKMEKVREEVSQKQAILRQEAAMERQVQEHFDEHSFRS